MTKKAAGSDNQPQYHLNPYLSFKYMLPEGGIPFEAELAGSGSHSARRKQAQSHTERMQPTDGDTNSARALLNLSQAHRWA